MDFQDLYSYYSSLLAIYCTCSEYIYSVYTWISLSRSRYQWDYSISVLLSLRSVAFVLLKSVFTSIFSGTVSFSSVVLVWFPYVSSPSPTVSAYHILTLFKEKWHRRRHLIQLFIYFFYRRKLSQSLSFSVCVVEHKKEAV